MASKNAEIGDRQHLYQPEIQREKHSKNTYGPVLQLFNLATHPATHPHPVDDDDNNSSGNGDNDSRDDDNNDNGRVVSLFNPDPHLTTLKKKLSTMFRMI